MFDTLKYPVLDLAKQLAGSVSGTGDPLSDTRILELVDWLDTRVESAWEPTVSFDDDYDNSVRAVGRAAVHMVRKYLQTNNDKKDTDT